MFFLIGFGWHVAASFAFLIAILSPNWLTFQTLPSWGNITVQRDVFYVCDLISKNSTYQTTRCVSIIQLNPSMNSTGQWNYGLAMASTSLAISCAGLSIIVLWLTGIHFNIRKRSRSTLCFLLFISFLIFITFLTSISVWILLISETVSLGPTVNRSILKWPTWLAVGASGGYFMAFITMILSFCTVCCRRRKRDEFYDAGNKF